MSFDSGVQPEGDVLSHLNGCRACLNYFESHQHAAGIVMRLKEQMPQLKQPEVLKSAILSNIGMKNEKGRERIGSMHYLVRILAAASVALLIMLGIEQYTILRKVQHLEMQLGKVQQRAPLQDWKLYQSSLVDVNAFLSKDGENLTMKKIHLLLKMRHLSTSDFTFNDLQRNINKEKTIRKLMSEPRQNKLKK